MKVKIRCQGSLPRAHLQFFQQVALLVRGQRCLAPDFDFREFHCVLWTSIASGLRRVVRRTFTPAMTYDAYWYRSASFQTMISWVPGPEGWYAGVGREERGQVWRNGSNT